MENHLKIGELAAQGEVNLQTIRYYEREGLLPRPPRLASGYRIFPSDAVQRVRFIKRAQELGFSLREIKELMELRIAPGATCAHVKKHAEAKIGDIEDKIRSLQRMKRALKNLTAACGGRGAVSACPILDALEDGKK
jgi:MerR family transcriptional regulator, copper efflux regulator